jgi:hypothetical protein
MIFIKGGEEMDNFSQEKWMERCRLFERNKRGLGFDVIFRISEDGKGKIKFRNLEDRYINTLGALACEVIHGTMLVFRDMVTPATYAREEDRQAQAALHAAELRNIERYVQVMLDEGIDKALDVFATKQVLIQFAYDAAHMSYEGGQWVSPCGDPYKDGVFVDRDTGKQYFSYYSPVWELLLDDGAATRESGRA